MKILRVAVSFTYANHPPKTRFGGQCVQVSIWVWAGGGEFASSAETDTVASKDPLLANAGQQLGLMVIVEQMINWRNGSPRYLHLLADAGSKGAWRRRPVACLAILR